MQGGLATTETKICSIQCLVQGTNGVVKQLSCIIIIALMYPTRTITYSIKTASKLRLCPTKLSIMAIYRSL